MNHALKRPPARGPGQEPRIFVVVAAYNEERKIGGVLDDLRTYGYRNIVVVDDASADRTSEVARSRSVQVVRHARNRGQGGALRTGIQKALEQGADVIVTFDGDGQHRAADIAEVVAPVLQGKADVALGSRFLGKALGIQKRKWLTLKGSILVERLLLGMKLTDVHNGFRALSRKAAETIEITCDGMAHASEIVAEIRDHSMRYVEVPVTILYDEYTKQKGQSILNSFGIFKEIMQMKRQRRLSHHPTAGQGRAGSLTLIFL
jgi:glycosyltransferase involved in cell wall biosynthesis